MAGAKTEDGFVIRKQGADYYVACGGEQLRCSLRGRFRIGESPEAVLPVVGDDVEFRRERGTDTRGPSGLILSIHPRRSIFARSGSTGKQRYRILGANLDYVFLVFSVHEPDLNLRLLDRMLVAAGCGGMSPVICVNKIDLAGSVDRVRRDMAPYGGMGYDLVFCSAALGDGLDRIRGMMAGRKSIMAGPSGTGKSSIIAALEPGIDLRIGSVSDRTGKGRHTTTHFELHPMAGGGYIGDSPGVREFGIWGVDRRTLAGYFPDLRDYEGQCRFTGCTHSHEPGCAVKEAVCGGDVRRERYDSYLRILQELPNEQR